MHSKLNNAKQISLWKWRAIYGKYSESADISTGMQLSDIRSTAAVQGGFTIIFHT